MLINPLWIFAADNKIEYFYDAVGTKQKKKVTDGTVITTTDYAGNYIYQNNALQMINQPEGYLEPNGQGTYDYGYRLKDHLGNIRLTFVDFDHNGSIALSEITEENNYYPFGLKHQGYNTGVTSTNLASKYKYNGKELNDELDLDWYDYGARFYDAQIGRFSTIDPMTEKIPDYTPYNYVRNNPILRVDPTGKWDVTVHLYNNREVYGYGVAIVSDRKGNEVYRFNVRAEGYGGRDRTKKNADTPVGVYDIPNNQAWLSGKSRKAFGPNYRLNMIPISGEAAEITTRTVSDIRIHGGGQEEEGTWEPLDNAELKKTNGCLRAFESDMINFKNMTDELKANDPLEYAGKVTINGDLKQKKTWKGIPYKENTTYHAPGDNASDEKKQNWNNLINSFLNQFK